MARTAAVLACALAAAAVAVAVVPKSAGAGTTACRTVVKKVRGGPKRVRVCPPADLVTRVTVAPERVTSGNEVVLTVSVENRGRTQARDVVVAVVAQGASVREILPPLPCRPRPRGRLECLVGTLATSRDVRPDSTALLVRVRTRAAGTLRLTARATSPTRDARRANNEATATVTVAPGSASANLSASVTPAPGPVSVGDDFSLTLTLRNDGPTEATGVALTPLLPSGVGLVDYAGPEPRFGECAAAITLDPRAVCLGTLRAGASVAITLTASAGPRAGGSVTQLFLVSASTPDPDMGDNTARVDTLVNPFTPLPGAELVVSLRASPRQVAVGTRIEFSVVVKNLGLDAADDVRLTFASPPPELVEIDAVDVFFNVEDGAPACTESASGERHECTLPSLGSGNTWKLTYGGFVGAAGSITATATVASATNDPNPANNTASISVAGG